MPLWADTERTVMLIVGAVLLPVADSHIVLELQEVGCLSSLDAVA